MENRNYSFIATIILKKGENVKFNKPSDDVVKWLHLELKNKHTIFYDIIEPNEAKYNHEFKAKVSLLEDDILKEIQKDVSYSLYRGQEKVGTLKFLEIIK